MTAIEVLFLFRMFSDVDNSFLYVPVVVSVILVDLTALLCPSTPATQLPSILTRRLDLARVGPCSFFFGGAYGFRALCHSWCVLFSVEVTGAVLWLRYLELQKRNSSDAGAKSNDLALSSHNNVSGGKYLEPNVKQFVEFV